MMTISQKQIDHFQSFVARVKEQLARTSRSLILSSFLINILSLSVPLLALQVYDRVLGNKEVSTGTLELLIIGVTCAVFLEFLLRLCRSYITKWVGATYEHQATLEAMHHSIDGTIDAVEKDNIGEHVQHVAAIGKLREFYSGNALLTLIDLPFTLIFLSLIAYLAGWLVLIPITLIIIFLMLSWNVGHNLLGQLHKRDNEDDKRLSFILENLHGIHTVKAMGLENNFLRKYEHIHSQNSLSHYHVSKASASAYNYGSIFAQMMMVGVITFGSPMVISGNITMGILAACILLSSRSLLPIQRALAVWIRFQDFEISKEKVDEMQHYPLDEKIAPESIVIHKGNLDCRDVSFAYSDKSPTLFQGVNLSLEPGESVTLLSDRKGGKTTLLHLLMGLYRPTEGDIIIDGIAAHQYPHYAMPEIIGYIPTETAIFQGTIRENITEFHSDKIEQFGEIVHALGLEEEISKLSKGYETILIDSIADQVPPGVKQLITIARVLVHKPKIILFDEADTSLDQKGVEHVYNYLKKQLPHSALVMVSHNERFQELTKSKLHL